MLPIDIPQPISDFLLVVNSNRITYRLQDFSRQEVENRHFRPLVLRYSPYRPTTEERKLYIVEKYSGLKLCLWQYGSIFIRLAVVASQICEIISREIPRKFELRAVQGHPRSSTLVLIESAYATSYCSFRNITSGFGRHFRWSVIIGIA